MGAGDRERALDLDGRTAWRLDLGQDDETRLLDGLRPLPDRIAGEVPSLVRDLVGDRADAVCALPVGEWLLLLVDQPVDAVVLWSQPPTLRLCAGRLTVHARLDRDGRIDRSQVHVGIGVERADTTLHGADALHLVPLLAPSSAEPAGRPGSLLLALPLVAPVFFSAGGGTLSPGSRSDWPARIEALAAWLAG